MPARRYLVHPKLSLLDKTRIQAQVLVPVLRALRAELGKGKADAIVRRALRGWSKQLFAVQNDINEQMRTIAAQATLTEMHALAVYYGG